MPDPAAKVIRNDVGIVDGVPSMLLYAKNSNGDEICVAVPLQGVRTLVANTRRLAHAMAVQTGRQTIGEWFSTTLLLASSYGVGTIPTTDGEKVALIFDRDQPAEIGFEIEPQDAVELAERLRAEANRLVTKRPRTN